MANIQSYPIGTASTDSLLVGTQMNVEQPDGVKVNLTRNFTVGQISTLITKDYTEVTRTLTNAEYLSSKTAGIIIVPGVTGKYIRVVSAYASFVYEAPNAFMWSQDLVLSNNTSMGNLNSNTIQARIPQDLEDIDGNEIAIFGLEAAKPVKGSPLRFGTPTTATLTGSGTIAITVRYQLI